MTKDEAVDKLQRQINAISELTKESLRSPKFKEWQRNTEIAITKIFGDSTRHSQDFRRVSYTTRTPNEGTHTYQPDERFKYGLENARSVLNSMCEEVKEYGLENTSKKEEGALQKIEKICHRFHLVAKQLRARRENKTTFSIDDEYDVQDLLHALLKVEFDDIRPEEHTPSYASNTSRMDFLLKQEQIVIETKKTRKGLGSKELGEQLIIDIEKYKVHPDCRVLVCFVYDPDAKISNPRGVENDLNRYEELFQAKVIITP
jgi:hypothetical protein